MNKFLNRFLKVDPAMDDNLLDDSGIRRLEELSAEQDDFSIIIAGMAPNRVDLKMDKGDGHGINLFSSPQISVARWYSSAGSEFPLHQHSQREWIICYSGSLTVHRTDGDHVLSAGEAICNEPGEVHSASFAEDCEYLAITIPQSGSWPHD